VLASGWGGLATAGLVTAVRLGPSPVYPRSQARVAHRPESRDFAASQDQFGVEASGPRRGSQGLWVALPDRCRLHLEVVWVPYALL